MLIIKGIIIGIGKIIPGVSGSMLAISMGIYQQLIDSINNFFSNPKKNLKFLIKIGLGVIISIIFLSNIILNCLNKYYFITMFFFIGLILGSFKDIRKNISNPNYLLSVIVFIIISLFGLLNIKNNITISNTFLNFIFYIIVGIIDAITMVVPGISGTATLMMIGVYNNLMESFSTVLLFSNFNTNFQILFPFGIGLIIGIIVTVKLIDYLFKNYKNSTYSIIIGFSMSTILIMSYKCFNSNYNLITLIFGFIAFFIGYYITKKINRYL